MRLHLFALAVLVAVTTPGMLASEDSEWDLAAADPSMDWELDAEDTLQDLTVDQDDLEDLDEDDAEDEEDGDDSAVDIDDTEAILKMSANQQFQGILDDVEVAGEQAQTEGKERSTIWKADHPKSPESQPPKETPKIHYMENVFANTNCQNCQNSQYRTCFKQLAQDAGPRIEGKAFEKCDRETAAWCKHKCFNNLVVETSARSKVWAKVQDQCLACVNFNTEKCKRQFGSNPQMCAEDANKMCLQRKWCMPKVEEKMEDEETDDLDPRPIEAPKLYSLGDLDVADEDDDEEETEDDDEEDLDVDQALADAEEEMDEVVDIPDDDIPDSAFDLPNSHIPDVENAPIDIPKAVRSGPRKPPAMNFDHGSGQPKNGLKPNKVGSNVSRSGMTLK